MSMWSGSNSEVETTAKIKKREIIDLKKKIDEGKQEDIQICLPFITVLDLCHGG